MMNQMKVENILKCSHEIFNFITDEYLQKRIILECIINEHFCKYVFKQITLLKKNQDAKTINSIFQNIHSKTLKYFNLVIEKKNNNSVYKNNILLSLSYFYLLESFDEHCKMNDDLIKNMKKQFGNEYLNIISEIDKKYLSDDMKKEHILFQVDSINKDYFNNDNIHQYILFKKWQDKQHNFYFNDFESKIFTLLKKNFPEFSKSDDIENEILVNKTLEIINKEKIVDINIISLLVKLDLHNEILNNYGGKAYGLATLNSIGVKIPWTAVIPVGKMLSLKQLENFIPKGISTFSVRSSADIEDGTKHSFAGMFDSYLDVKRDELVEAIKKVKKSVYNKRLKSYISKNNLNSPHMAVIIEQFLEPEKSGIWIGTSLNSGMLEYTDGNGEKIVSGQVIPEREIWNSKSQKNNRLQINEKYVGKMLIEIQKKLKTIADFEWMILNQKLVLLQFRPVTTKIQAKKIKISCNNKTICGIACSPGKVEGKIQFLNSFQEKFEKGNILLAWITDPEWLPHMLNAKGVITASGGFLCHAGIICRELGIPCVTGIGKEAIKYLSIQENMIVTLDGNSGTITIKN